MLGKLQQAVAAGRLAADSLPGGRGLMLSRPAAGWTQVADRLQDLLTPLELQETRVLTGERPSPDADGHERVMQADRFCGEVRGLWLSELLDEARLTAWFQPIVDRDRLAFGHEALARGLSHDGGVIAPQAMLEAAATPQLLARFDRLARLTAAGAADRAGLPGHLFVNFVPSTIYDPEQCLRSTVAAMTRLDLDPEAVVFEVVESYCIDDMAHLKRIFDRYRAHGFGVALDDFGAGYATLEALVHLRPDFVKIDKEMARRCRDDDFCRRLVGEIVRLAHEEGIKVIAEGIEDRAGFDLLREIGADLFQGYLFGRPAPLPAAGPARATDDQPSRPVAGGRLSATDRRTSVTPMSGA